MNDRILLKATYTKKDSTVRRFLKHFFSLFMVDRIILKVTSSVKEQTSKTKFYTSVKAYSTSYKWHYFALR